MTSVPSRRSRGTIDMRPSDRRSGPAVEAPAQDRGPTREDSVPVTRERFEQGMTYDQYKAQMTRNKERFEENEKNVQVSPDDLQAFRNLPEAVNVAVLAEDWCGDV